MYNPRKKKVSFCDLVERIPESFRHGAETNSDTFVCECEEVFYLLNWIKRSLR